MSRAGRIASAAVSLSLIALTGCSPEPSVELIPFPGTAGSGQPRLTADTDGRPLISWLEPDGGEHVLRFALIDDDLSVGPIHDVARSDRMFVNWADFPSVTPITAETWFAHWLRERPDSSAYDVATAISHDGGLSWQPAEQMNEDATDTEHGFVAVLGTPPGFTAFWLDSRELANWSFDEPDALLGVSLREAQYRDDGSVASRSIVDDLVCDCCQPDVAMAASAPIIIYRNRTPEEIRDVVVRRYHDGSWSEPLDLGNENWFIEGCPVNGPVIAAHDDDVVAAWFTAADGQSRVRFARSIDGGQSFAAPVDVDATGSLGQTGIVIDDNGRAVVTWWRRGREGGIDLLARSYDPDGAAGPTVRVGHEAIGQAIDVPQLIRGGDAYLVAWTTLDGDGNVRLARLEL